MSITWIESPQGEAGGGLPAGTDNDVLRYADGRWTTATGVLAVREDGVDIGGDDDHYHNIQGLTTVFGDDVAEVFTVLGTAGIDRLEILDYMIVAGGQYPSYYGYGIGGNQYPGFPYWGSYPDGAAGPQHGNGTTIDRRGIRTDAEIVAERGITVYDVERNEYLTVVPRWDGVALSWDTSTSDREPYA